MASLVTRLGRHLRVFQGFQPGRAEGCSTWCTLPLSMSSQCPSRGGAYHPCGESWSLCKEEDLFEGGDTKRLWNCDWRLGLRRCKRRSTKQLLEMPCWTLPVFCLITQILFWYWGVPVCRHIPWPFRDRWSVKRFQTWTWRRICPTSRICSPTWGAAICAVMWQLVWH